MKTERRQIVNLSISKSTITLRVNGLNISSKRQRLAEWIKNHNPTVCCYKQPTSYIMIQTGWKVKRMGNIYHLNTNQRKARVLYK